MSCDHCVVAVTGEVGHVAGVQAVDVDLETKLVRVTGAGVDDAAVVAAIDEAGYDAVRGVSAPLKLAGFAALLALVFGVAAAVGRVRSGLTARAPRMSAPPRRTHGGEAEATWRDGRRRPRDAPIRCAASRSRGRPDARARAHRAPARRATALRFAIATTTGARYATSRSSTRSACT